MCYMLQCATREALLFYFNTLVLYVLSQGVFTLSDGPSMTLYVCKCHVWPIAGSTLAIDMPEVLS